MKNQFNLDIKTPCQENFNQFAPTSNGGFCGACKKEVIDFTTMNAEEIVTFFKNKSTQNTCGRFNSSQLSPKTQIQNTNKRIGFLSGIGLACLALFSTFSTQAQAVKNELEPVKEDSKIETSKSEKNMTVKGTVNEDGIPLPGANIVLQGTAIGTSTNFDGYFEFPAKLKVGDVLVVSYLGFETQKVVIEKSHSDLKIELNIDMKVDSCIIMGKVAVKQVYKSKRD
ncbi:carboxypeptidase-like regulatory domain-containing protein [Winogradskyella forsetii]|uniref:carboxypeptidase-like regulatory domain-containing protein n=1 Tax=Winogradskyella forsetii TaxID=2686077 RepID=UPI0015BAAFB4|nr:carboxypeptidase-like regulatory domain-containing protein [Winogradskyella forsetii]